VEPPPNVRSTPLVVLLEELGKKPVLVCPGGKSAGLEHVPSVFPSLDIRKISIKNVSEAHTIAPFAFSPSVRVM
jgi:hypothetical protein